MARNNKTGWILGIARGHNASICLLKDGEIVFSIEEERLSRQKYDGAPLAGMVKVLEYTDKIDYLVISHTQPDDSHLDFSGDPIYEGLARKLKLISSREQVVYMHEEHHKVHSAIAFYRSGFDKATSLIVDGAGTFREAHIDGQPITVWEVESIFDCSYPANFNLKYQHLGGRGPFTSMPFEQDGCEYIIDSTAGIVKSYEAVTEYCGWSSIEAGKTMGLFPYGKANKDIPELMNRKGKWNSIDRDVIIPTYPNGSKVDYQKFKGLCDTVDMNMEDLTQNQNRRDMAWQVQTTSQQAVLDLILKSVEMTGNKKIVISGGYGLNCVANYFYLNTLKDLDIEIYVEPISNDAGTSIGGALLQHYILSQDETVRPKSEDLYLGPKHTFTSGDIEQLADKFNADIVYDRTYSDVIDLLQDKNIIAMFQGRSENGPRALGNRSILFDPTFKDGKDFVNGVKHREYFRPFASSVLEDKAKEWFDLRGMESSPSMMYAVNCLDGVAEQIPSVIHVDDTCRIQTVNQEQNRHYYNLISEFDKRTGVPLLFNTSFNLGGEPLVETLEDALRTLQNSEIDYLYLPEFDMIIHLEMLR